MLVVKYRVYNGVRENLDTKVWKSFQFRLLSVFLNTRKVAGLKSGQGHYELIMSPCRSPSSLSSLRHPGEG